MRLLHGDCREILKSLPDASVDSIVTDPPYELGFMGKSWDSTGVAYDVTVWQECLRVLKPGGHLLAFGGSRTYHRLAVAIEDAGFQIRDQIMWVYGSGFPKSHNIGKAIDKQAGVEREVVGHSNINVYKENKNHKFYVEGEGNPEYGKGEVTAPNTVEAKQWDGWGTALKPAHEPIVMARKPIEGTVANNVVKHGVGGINIDGTRVAYPDGEVDFDKVQRQQATGEEGVISNAFGASALVGTEIKTYKENGRFPANFIHDGSDEVLALFPDTKGAFAPVKSGHSGKSKGIYNDYAQRGDDGATFYDDNGSAARFFYCAKANKKERNAGASNNHPTVKPTDLMRYLVRLVTPPNGTVLDPFTGSGSTGRASVLEGFDFIGIEQSAEYLAIAEARIAFVSHQADDESPTLFE